eukprot:TRINITY_DN3793_c3_g1_i1.p1 TRINITY_DN3793_c3_g1~~TRINITY_DN3793_c3_g1_i1.p1  ORF type:complete len:764 (+),score=253.38 TRINITY_DN3793_c3_g1_i1:70-2292(+)
MPAKKKVIVKKVVKRPRPSAGAAAEAGAAAADAGAPKPAPPPLTPPPSGASAAPAAAPPRASQPKRPAPRPAAPAPAPAPASPPRPEPPVAEEEELVECPDCGGDGVLGEGPCTTCSGDGEVPASAAAKPPPAPQLSPPPAAAPAAAAAAPAAPPPPLENTAADEDGAKETPAAADGQQAQDGDQGIESVMDSSDDDSGAQELRGRKRLRNAELLGTFISLANDYYPEPEIGEAREKPVMSDNVKAKLEDRKRRRIEEAKDAGLSPIAEFPGGGAFPTTPLSSAPPETPLESTMGGDGELGDMVNFDDIEEGSKAKHLMPMWARRAYTHRNRFVRMHQEVYDLCNWMKPTEEEDVMRKKVICDMQDLSEELFPGSHVLAFGSVVTGLVMPTSDVDCTIVWDGISNTYGHERTEILHSMLDKIAKRISDRGMCDDAFPNVIKHTKVPIVKFTHKETWIDVDISIDSPNGRVNSELVVRYCRSYPIAQPLISVVKYFLQQRSMHEPYTGGLGSYAVTLAVISFLQNHPALADPDAARQAGMGGLLVDFFRVYGSLMDFQTVGIRVRDGRYIRKQPHHYTRDRGGLYCEDPQDPSNNVTASTRQMHSIRSAFNHAFHALVSDRFPEVAEAECSAEHPMISHRPTLLSRIIHIDRALLDRREKVRRAFARWFDKHPEQTPQHIRDRFAELQNTGARVRKLLARICAGHPGMEDMTDADCLEEDGGEGGGAEEGEEEEEEGAIAL